MAGNKDNFDAFDLLNQELSRYEPEDEESYEASRRARPLLHDNNGQDETDGDEYDESGKRGCVGTVLRLLLIILLAAALAWIVFMPEGSLGELWDSITPTFDQAASWVTGFFSGTSSDDSEDSGSSSEPADVAKSLDRSVASDKGVSSQSVQSTETDTEDASYSITVFRPDQIVIVYDSLGNPVKVFSCSSGKDSSPTNPGDYAIRAKYRWRLMVGDCYTQYASSFSSGYLFHSIPYSIRNPGTMSDSSYDKLGNPASSGCVRLCFRDTKWIYDHCPVGTQVHVVDENAPAGSVPEIIPERIKDKTHNGWDPTDDSPDSPYNQ